MEDKRNDAQSHFVTARTHLPIGNAAAAIILLEDGRYLLQLRDDIESIWYPGHWGCFGGGVEPSENSLAALQRELQEELAFKLDKAEASFFTELEFDLAGLGLGRYYRKYYLIRMNYEEMAQLRLSEGETVAAFDGDTILGSLKVSPYDSFALFLHARASRIGRE
jgi:8-oxo-dGTP pyrophosphatase MutT (NUDIX family)